MRHLFVDRKTASDIDCELPVCRPSSGEAFEATGSSWLEKEVLWDIRGRHAR